MIKIFLTGDNHIGRSGNNYPLIKDRIEQSRFDSLQRMVQIAEENECNLFVVSGDLFDKTSVTKTLVKRTVEILSEFNGEVLVLPGNHDYYSKDVNVWKYFNEVNSKCILLNEFKKYELDIDDEIIDVYPAYCESKHSSKNNLDWIKDSDIDASRINIGIAHGCIRGLSPDMKDEYFPMTKEELNAINVDVWLIGHMHIPYPSLSNNDERGHKVFNAGTNEQLDSGNNTTGQSFIITIQDDKTVLAHKVDTGNLFYKNIDVLVNKEEGLKKSLNTALEGLNQQNTVLKLTISGNLDKEDYENRNSIINSLTAGFLDVRIVDDNLVEEITMDRIKEEFADTGFAVSFLSKLSSDSKTLQMAYDLVKESRD